MNAIADLTLGMGSQARAVLQLLSDRGPDFADEDGDYQVYMETRPWYNGRERGFVLSMRREYPRDESGVINIAIFEHRNADHLVGLSWTTDSIPFQNGVVADDETLDIAYANYPEPDAEFPHGRIGECADWIYERLESHYNKSKSNS
jgi:hypothetical protein